MSDNELVLLPSTTCSCISVNGFTGLNPWCPDHGDKKPAARYIRTEIENGVIVYYECDELP